MSKYSYNDDYFKKIDTAEKAYWLGFLYADGCITRFYRGEKLKSMSLELTLKNEDCEHLVKFKNALESNVPIQHKVVAGKYRADRIVINNTKMCRDLIKLGCTPTKSLTLEFPDNDIVPIKFINDFVRGYFDGDGGISYTEGEYYHSERNKFYKQYHYRCYFCGTEQFLTELKNVLNFNDIKTSDLKKDNRSNAVNIYIYGKENIEKFKKYLYTNNCVSLSRKFDKFFFISQNENLLINN